MRLTINKNSLLLAVTYIVMPGSFCFAQSRQLFSLNEDWRIFKGDFKDAKAIEFDDSNWLSVIIPHTWNTDLVQKKGDYKGTSWYRRTLKITPERAGKRLFLQCEDALTVADVYLNGKKPGQHQGGYSAFAYEITSMVNAGEDNILAARVDNADNKDIPLTDSTPQP